MFWLPQELKKCQELSIFIFLAQIHFKGTQRALRALREYLESTQRVLREHSESTKIVIKEHTGTYSGSIQRAIKPCHTVGA